MPGITTSGLERPVADDELSVEGEEDVRGVERVRDGLEAASCDDLTKGSKEIFGTTSDAKVLGAGAVKEDFALTAFLDVEGFVDLSDIFVEIEKGLGFVVDVGFHDFLSMTEATIPNKGLFFLDRGGVELLGAQLEGGLKVALGGAKGTGGGRANGLDVEGLEGKEVDGRQRIGNGLVTSRDGREGAAVVNVNKLALSLDVGLVNLDADGFHMDGRVVRGLGGGHKGEGGDDVLEHDAVMCLGVFEFASKAIL